MPQPIVYIDTSEVRKGRLDELEAKLKDLAAFVEANVPRLISYGFYFNEERTRMTVVAVHPDSESLEYHLDTGGKEFRKFAELIELSSIEVYGQVGDPVLERLHRKARMLGRGTVTVHDFHAGFAR